MATDYVLLIHGVNTRSVGTQPTYANNLITHLNQHNPIEPLVVYWGDVNKVEEEQICKGYEASSIWDKLWFRDIRAQQIVRFAGDAALYLSRYVGAKVAGLVAVQVAKLRNCTAQDRLHLVTHSLGTIIFFDLLFSARWDEEDMPGHDSVMAIRDAVYGVKGNDPDPKQGIRLGSITTMGSPIAIFSLTDVNQEPVDAKNAQGEVISTHDITPRLEQLLDNLHTTLDGKKLPWRNFVHPGDPIASPLEGIVPDMVDGRRQYIDLHDVLVPDDLLEILKKSPFQVALDVAMEPLHQTAVALLTAGNAHSSYWDSQHVADGITQLIQQAKPAEAGA